MIAGLSRMAISDGYSAIESGVKNKTIIIAKAIFLFITLPDPTAKLMDSRFPQDAVNYNENKSIIW